MCKTSNTQNWKEAQLEKHQLPSPSREAGQAADPTPGSSPGNMGRGPTRHPSPHHHPREVKADATQTRTRRPHAGPKASATAGSQEGMGVLGRMRHRHTRTTQPVVVNGPLSGNEGDTHSPLLHTQRTSWRRERSFPDPSRGWTGKGGRAGSALRHAIDTHQVPFLSLDLRKGISLPPSWRFYLQVKDKGGPMTPQGFTLQTLLPAAPSLCSKTSGTGTRRSGRCR